MQIVQHTLETYANIVVKAKNDNELVNLDKKFFDNSLPSPFLFKICTKRNPLS